MDSSRAKGKKVDEMDRGVIRILYTNAQSMMNKINELKAVVETKKPDIVAMTETWTNEGIPNGVLSLEGYKMVDQNDQNDMEGG